MYRITVRLIKHEKLHCLPKVQKFITSYDMSLSCITKMKFFFTSSLMNACPPLFVHPNSLLINYIMRVLKIQCK